MLEPAISLVRRRPVEAPAITADGIDIRLMPAEARFKLRLPPSALAARPTAAGFRLDLGVNRFHDSEGRLAMRLGPDEWILTAPDADAELIAGELKAALGDRVHSLVDIGHRHVAFDLAGANAAHALNAGCALDLDPRAFPVGMATRTLLGKAEVVLLRIGADTWRLECWRSFAEHVHAFLAEAAREHTPG